MVVAGGLDGTAEFLKSDGEALVRFLDVHLAELDAEIGFREAKT